MTEEKKTTKSTKLTELIKEIEKLSVLELADLVKALEEKFGVSSMPQVTAAPSGQVATNASQPAGETTSEQTTFNVVLADTGTNKISVIKAVREVNPNLGLKEAKDLVESAPKEVVGGANKQAAAEAQKKLEAAGAKVELK